MIRFTVAIISIPFIAVGFAVGMVIRMLYGGWSVSGDFVEWLQR